MIDVLAMIISLIIYFIPTIVAFFRDRGNKGWIALVNLLTGWTLLGWVFTLVWAFSTEKYTSYTPDFTRRYRESDEKKECPNCKSQVDMDYSSCPKCGHKFEKEEAKEIVFTGWTCQACGTMNSKNTMSCTGCGKYK